MGFDATEFLAGLFGEVTVSDPNTEESVSEHGPPASDALNDHGLVDCPPALSGSAMAAYCDVDDQANEWHWRHIGADDRQHLLGPAMSDRPTNRCSPICPTAPRKYSVGTSSEPGRHGLIRPTTTKNGKPGRSRVFSSTGMRLARWPTSTGSPAMGTFRRSWPAERRSRWHKSWPDTQRQI